MRLRLVTKLGTWNLELGTLSNCLLNLCALCALLRLGLRLAFELVELLSQEPQMVSHLLCLLIT